MDNKLTSIILASIGYAILILTDIGIALGVLLCIIAYHYWTKHGKEEPCHPEEEIGGNEMDNDVSPVER